jgi:hypothetical protein
VSGSFLYGGAENNDGATDALTFPRDLFVHRYKARAINIEPDSRVHVCALRGANDKTGGQTEIGRVTDPEEDRNG